MVPSRGGVNASGVRPMAPHSACSGPLTQWRFAKRNTPIDGDAVKIILLKILQRIQEQSLSSVTISDKARCSSK
jgi:hypothetical protein